MSDSKKDSNSNMPKFKFNAYWIYGAIFILIVAVQFFSSGDLATKSISKNEFNEILKENDISRIVVVNNNLAQIYIKDESLKKERYKKKNNPAVNLMRKVIKNKVEYNG